MCGADKKWSPLTLDLADAGLCVGFFIIIRKLDLLIFSSFFPVKKGKETVFCRDYFIHDSRVLPAAAEKHAIHLV